MSLKREKRRSRIGSKDSTPPPPQQVRTALARIETGNLGDVKPVGQGVLERRITFGPGYRFYFGQDGDKFAVLLCGSTKNRRSKDIEQVKAFWDDYKSRKQKGD